MWTVAKPVNAGARFQQLCRSLQTGRPSLPRASGSQCKNVLAEPPLHWLGGLNKFLLAHSKCYDRVEFHHSRSVFISLGCFGKGFKIGIKHFYQTRLVVIAAAVVELKERPEKMAQSAKWHPGKQEDMSADP